MQLKTREEIEILKKETNAEVTERVANELRAARKEEMRRDTVYNFFFELTGAPMREEWYKAYIKIFDGKDSAGNQTAPRGYNIKTFIESIKKEIEAEKKLLHGI